MDSTDPIETFVMMEAYQAYHTYKIVRHSFEKLEAVASGN